MEFSPKAAILFAWETFKQRPWFFVGAAAILAVLYIVASAISSGVDGAFGGSSEEPTLPGTIVSYLLGTLISMGATAFFLNAHDSPETADYSALWHPTPFWSFFATSVLATLAMGIGLLLLIVPGLIAMVLFMFSTFIVIDRGLGPIDALKESMRLTEGNRWPLFGFLLLLVLIALAGALAFGVGLLVAMPIVTLAIVHAYRLLSGASPRIAPPDANLAA